MFIWVIFKIISVLLLSLVAFVLLYLFFATLLSHFTTRAVLSAEPITQIVYALSNGVHTDLVFKVDQLDATFRNQLAAPLGIKPYVAIGWGDKGFYLHTPSWAELKLSTALRAAFLPSETLMHLSFYGQIEAHWKEIPLSEQQIQALLKFVMESFKKDSKGYIQLLRGAGFTANDFFYKAVGHYTCFYTCNVWVNQALKKAAVQTAIWSPFEKGIFKHL